MKFFAAIVLSFLLVAANIVLIQCQEEDIMATKKEAFSQCSIEHNISKEAVHSIMNHENVPNDSEVKCWLGCVFKKLGVLKKGNIDWDRCIMLTKHCLSNDQDKAKVDEIANICRAEVPKDEKDECELAYSVAVCKINNWNNLGLPISDGNE
ncbi:unnamed protein product [Nezara viridula]|uniref:Uncharacterized protein n=1 Tax=Nezara viridula TaxID=85310 RepID=A0A9P0H3D8_NEZVI|nr:unnamed protein product [Nezara viridula]